MRKVVLQMMTTLRGTTFTFVTDGIESALNQANAVAGDNDVIGDFRIMNKTFIAKATITINAPTSKVWDALTKPHLIKQYLFGTEVTSDWQVGSPMTYKGIWEGKAYEDKGRVLQIEPGKLLVSTFWSSLSGSPDIPENYKTVRYELSTEEDGTRLTITQDNNDSQEEANHSEQNWKMVLDGMKKLLEG